MVEQQDPRESHTRQDAPEPACVPAEWEDIPLVAVLPRLQTAGINPPGYERPDDKGPQTYDWRFPRYSPQNSAGVYGAAVVMPLRDALLKSWDTEAMALRYLVRGPSGRVLARQPRINKPGVAWLEAQGYSVVMRTLLADHDTPAHREWTDADEAAYVAVCANPPPALAQAFLYKTGRGWRSGVPLDRDVPIAEAERLIRAWMLWIERGGVEVDWKCRDWTHVFRMPRTYRPGKGERADHDPEDGPCAPLDPAVAMAHYAPDPADVARAERAEARRAKKRLASDAEPLDPATDAADDVPDGASGASPREPRPRRPPRAPPVARVFAKALPPWWTPRVEVLAAAVVANAAATRAAGGHHGMFLALAGALLARDAPPEYVPEVVRRVAESARGADLGSATPASALRAARDTVYAADEGRAVAGMPRLRARWRWIADALDRAMGHGVRAEAEARSEPLPTLEEARKGVYEFINATGHGDGSVRMVKAPPGLGKSFQALEAARVLATTAGSGFRRVALSFDKNDLAAQSEAHLAERGQAARRYRSPLAVRAASGAPECRLYPVAALLQAGGQFVGLTLCDGQRRDPSSGCVHRPTVGGDCAAYGAWSQLIATGEAPPIELYNHALLRRHEDFLRRIDLLVIDEPPPILASTTVSLDAIRAALGMLLGGSGYFARRYERAMAPVLMGLGAWLQEYAREPDGDRATDERVQLEDAVREGLAIARSTNGTIAAVLADALDATGLVTGPFADDYEAAIAAARLAVDPAVRPPPVAPMLRRWVVRAAVQRHAVDPAGAAAFAAPWAQASSVYAAVRDGLLDRLDLDAARKATVIGRVVPERAGAPRRTVGAVATLIAPDLDLLAALERPGPTILLDANAELHAPVLRRLFGWNEKQLAERTHVARAAERATVQRGWWKRGGANRGTWILHGRPVWTAGLARDLEMAIGWCANPPEGFEGLLRAPLCFVSYRPVVLAMRMALGQYADAARAAWLESGLTVADADEARAALERPLARWTGPWMLGHYGALRGMNSMDQARTYVALGDPWVSLDAVRAEASWLGVPLVDRWRARCEAEGEQVFGRSRSACRDTYIRMLHVGNVRPGGSYWSSNDISIYTDDPRPIVEFKPDDLREMREEMDVSMRAMAGMLGISHTTLARYENGDCRIPATVYYDILRLYSRR